MTGIEESTSARGLTDEILGQIATPYENRDSELSGGTVHVGSYIDAMGKKRITVVYPAADTHRVAALTRAQRVYPLDTYRTTLSQYLGRELSVV